MTIQHLVISGGGATGIKSLGILQHLEVSDFWKIENIQTIYATSAGAIIALLIALKFDWNTINDYILLRRWHEAYPIDIQSFFDAFSKKGILGSEIATTFFKPFFSAKDLSLEMTMKEFYEYSKIELHFFSLEMNSFQIENISYKTFPDLLLLTAIHMTCALPLVICPVILREKCYIDGGVIHNYPLNICMEEQGLDINCDEILAIKNKYDHFSNDETDETDETDKNDKNGNIGLSKKSHITNESTILDYMMIFINKLIMNVDTEGKQKSVKYEILCHTEHIRLDTLKSALYSADFRKELLNSGIETAIHFLSKLEEELETKEENLNNSIQELS
jgi:predicted acylesterase/phospholipase RssA